MTARHSFLIGSNFCNWPNWSRLVHCPETQANKVGRFWKFRYLLSTEKSILQTSKTHCSSLVLCHLVGMEESSSPYKIFPCPGGRTGFFRGWGRYGSPRFQPSQSREQNKKLTVRMRCREFCRFAPGPMVTVSFLEGWNLPSRCRFELHCRTTSIIRIQYVNVETWTPYTTLVDANMNIELVNYCWKERNIVDFGSLCSEQDVKVATGQSLSPLVIGLFSKFPCAYDTFKWINLATFPFKQLSPAWDHWIQTSTSISFHVCFASPRG